MNTGAPGQKSKLVESFLLLSPLPFRLPLLRPSVWPGRCKYLWQVALPCEAGCGAGLRERRRRRPERRERGHRPGTPPGTDRHPLAPPAAPQPPRRDQLFPSRENTYVKNKGKIICPFMQLHCARNYPRLLRSKVHRQSRGGLVHPLPPPPGGSSKGKYLASQSPV